MPSLLSYSSFLLNSNREPNLAPNIDCKDPSASDHISRKVVLLRKQQLGSAPPIIYLHFLRFRKAFEKNLPSFETNLICSRHLVLPCL
jgi:hypothetical protein